MTTQHNTNRYIDTSTLLSSHHHHSLIILRLDQIRSDHIRSHQIRDACEKMTTQHNTNRYWHYQPPLAASSSFSHRYQIRSEMHLIRWQHLCHEGLCRMNIGTSNWPTSSRCIIVILSSLSDQRCIWWDDNTTQQNTDRYWHFQPPLGTSSFPPKSLQWTNQPTEGLFSHHKPSNDWF